eukprot:TRINITY_DN8733_c0_g1_i3.p1 TRINITY_DN8733_c0_g1~~TRINITY_DN8733_c0_g1_i3.p1  ORF type:complete len:530 (-),score=88.97 TRINITY_DN8733_c0_g1_i3:339-1724(-)
MDFTSHCTLSKKCNQKVKKSHTIRVFEKNCTLPPGVVRVIGPSGINYTDIGYGSKDASSMLAGLMSVAYFHPEVLEAMFVERELWPKHVYRTKWFYHGREIIVSVDNMIPAADVGKPSFANFSSTGEVWPMIVVKAWAKLHKSYAQIKSGLQLDFMSALTQAPVEFVYHGSDATDAEHVTTDLLWKKLENATRDGFAMTASTMFPNKKEKRSGLVDGHEYAVLKAGMHEGKRSVMCANPSGKDSYKGHHSAGDSGKGDGIFWMTLEEYHRAFAHTAICKILKDYGLISVPIKPDKDAEIEVEVSSAKPFWVSLSKPTAYQMDNYLKEEGCKKEWYDFDTQVSITRPSDAHRARVVGGTRWGLGHIVSTEVNARPADKTWLIKASAKSKAKDYWTPKGQAKKKRSIVDNLYVVIYGHVGGIHLRKGSKPRSSSLLELTPTSASSPLPSEEAPSSNEKTTRGS